MNTVTHSEASALQRHVASVFDEHGFFLDSSSWTREAACHIGAALGIGTLTAEHWAVISCVRGRYLRHGGLTPVRQICRACGMDRDAIERLFGGYRNLWRVAGLPDPGEEAKAYMR